MQSGGSYGPELLGFLELLPTPAVLLRLDDGAIIWLSSSGAGLIGAEENSQVVGKSILEFVATEQHAFVTRDMHKLMQGADRVSPLVYTLQRTDGKTGSVHVESIPLVFNDTPAALSLLVDVTEREDALIALGESETRYRSLVESSPDAILVSVAGEIVYANPTAAADAARHGVTELEGCSVFEFLPSDPDHVGRLKQLYTEGGVLPWIETIVRYHDDHAFPAEIHTTLIAWHGEPAAQTVVRDISRRKAAEAEIREYQDHLQQLVDERTRGLERAMAELESMNLDLMNANAAKSSFMAAMSHELRTPLNSIIGFSAILEKGLAGELNEEQAKQIEIINAAGRQLLGLVGNVLDLERIESGRTEVITRELAPVDMAIKLVEMVRPLAENKGLHISCIPGEDLPQRLRTDQLKLEQIIMNLLANGIKYTDTGSVVLSLSADEDWFRFTVKDTGPGVPPDQHDLIFEEFYQHSTRDNVAKPVGAGLGLAIARRLADLLGGRLWLESEEDVGSTFALELPLA